MKNYVCTSPHIFHIYLFILEMNSPEVTNLKFAKDIQDYSADALSMTGIVSPSNCQLQCKSLKIFESVLDNHLAISHLILTFG